MRRDYLFEDRTLADLFRQPGVVLTASGAGATQIVAAHVPAGALPAARAVVEGTADPRTLPGVVVQTPEGLSTAFVRKLHKAAPPVVLAARPERAAALERHLFDGSYKGVTDLVTKWVWPRPARAVTGFCARHGIPPNAVTSVSFALVVAATVLFARGNFAAGLMLAWIMTFLDTVDGKLARVTVSSTEFGHYFDHTIDSVHPPIWYIAWAWGVAGGLSGISPLIPLLAAILVFYIGGRFIETFFKNAVAGVLALRVAAVRFVFPSGHGAAESQPDSVDGVLSGGTSGGRAHGRRGLDGAVDGRSHGPPPPGRMGTRPLGTLASVDRGARERGRGGPALGETVCRRPCRRTPSRAVSSGCRRADHRP